MTNSGNAGNSETAAGNTCVLHGHWLQNGCYRDLCSRFDIFDYQSIDCIKWSRVCKSFNANEFRNANFMLLQSCCISCDVLFI